MSWERIVACKLEKSHGLDIVDAKASGQVEAVGVGRDLRIHPEWAHSWVVKLSGVPVCADVSGIKPNEVAGTEIRGVQSASVVLFLLS